MSRRGARPGLEERGVELWATRTPRWQLVAAALVSGAIMLAACWVLGTFVGELLRGWLR